MTSKLIVNSIRHTGASADAITMDASGNVTFPANATCSGTATGFGVEGITMAQRYVFTSPVTFGSSWSTLNNNISVRGTYIGSSMTESSGVFTFPSTGIYRVSFYGNWLDQSANNDYLGQKVQYSTDGGSNWVDGVQGWVSGQTNDYASQTVSMIFDVTNVSTHKVRFRAQSQGNGGAFLFGSNASDNSTLNYFEFIRLGDT